MPIKVPSDRLGKVKRDYKKKMDYMSNTMRSGPEFVPVDLYGARTDYTPGTNDVSENMRKASKDIQERFGLEPQNSYEGRGSSL